MASDTRIYFDGPSLVAIYDSFGEAWDWFMSAALDNINTDTSEVMLEHETYDDEKTIAVFKGRTLNVYQWPPRKVS